MFALTYAPVRRSLGSRGDEHARTARRRGPAGSLVDEGKFVVRIDSVFPLSDAAKAYERSEAGHLSGKIVLTLPEA